ncbi:MAG: hypothetical protein HON90_08540 [Halobacteriovoraceae bacterium]|jgi:flagellar biosynthesis protein FlhF|nr:hypothetical protein [Halobacteriovoraceae bacterium]
MYVKKFEGDSLDETLKSVKAELGPDAIILKTVTNKGLKGAFKKRRIEITAAISEQSYEKKARVDHVLTDGQKEQFYQAPASRINNMIDDYDQNRSKLKESHGTSYGSIGLNKVVQSVSTASHKIKNSLDDFLTMEEEAPKSESDFQGFIADEAHELESHELSHDRTEREVQRLDTQHTIQANQEYNEEISSELRQEIKTQKHQIDLLEKKLFELTEKISETRVEYEQKIPLGIRSLRMSLRSLDLSESITQKILKKASFELLKDELESHELTNDFALREISELIRVELPLFSRVDSTTQPVVTTLISENSCGQTSMAMKLAALQENVRIIRFRENELDTHDADFTARIFKLNITTVNTLAHLMSEARKAIHDNQSLILDLKLNFKETNESKKFIETLKRSFDHMEILTIISGIHSELYNRKILSKYKPFSDGVIVSYMDQCLSFGSLLNVHAEHSELPLKFFGTGAIVPDDIEAASVERLLAGMFRL